MLFLVLVGNMDKITLLSIQCYITIRIYIVISKFSVDSFAGWLMDKITTWRYPLAHLSLRN